MNKEELIAKLDRLFPDKRVQEGEEDRYFYKNMMFSVRDAVAPMLIIWRLTSSSARFYYTTHAYFSGCAQSRLYIL